MTDEQATAARPRTLAWWSTQSTLPDRPAHPGRRKAVIVIAAVVVIALVAGFMAFQVQRSKHHTIHGALDVGSMTYNSQCRLAPIYHGIHEGTPVVIRDMRGTVIGRSTLGPGTGVGPFCEFLFDVPVPSRDLYSIEVDHRGSIVYSKAYFDFFRWQAGLALNGAKVTWQ